MAKEKDKGWGTGELIRTSAGFRWRVRLGKLGRQTIPLLAGLTAAQAEKRREGLVDALAKLKRAMTAPPRMKLLLEQLALAEPVEFDLLVQVVDEQCKGVLVEVAPRSGKPTFRQVAEDWTSGELARRYPDQLKPKKSVDSDIHRLNAHVFSRPIAAKPIDQVTLADCEEVMAALSPALAAATRRHVGQLLVRILKLAVYPLKLIPANPIPQGFLPKLSARKAQSYLYIDEDARLMAATHIPVQYRLLWGFLAREGMRLGEATALTWGDLDLKRGAVRLDTNKTDDPRAWVLNDGVARALRTFRKKFAADAQSKDLVFVDDSGRTFEGVKTAKLLREHLRTIGLDRDRPELFENSKSRQAIRAHDLRATFITHSLANGKSEAWISDRTGHTSSQMIHRYKRAARSAAELVQGELARLDRAIPELLALSERT